MVPFSELTFEMTLIWLFLRVILIKDQILFEGMHNHFLDYNIVVTILNLRDTRYV
jgi:hypothetical protein